MAKYYVNYYNANGLTVSEKLNSETLLGAKREAWKYATGDTIRILILDENDVAVASRIAKDSYFGFCFGAYPWDTKSEYKEITL